MTRVLVKKLLVFVLLGIALTVALAAIEIKIRERSYLRNQAIGSIAMQLAGEQTLTGPVVFAECREKVTTTKIDDKGIERSETKFVDCSRTIRPTTFSLAGIMKVNERSRGIYKARVFEAETRLNAAFDALKAGPNQEILSAWLSFGLSDPRGIRSAEVKDETGNIFTAQPGIKGDIAGAGFRVELDKAKLQQAGTSIETRLDFAGTGRFGVVPIGTKNVMELRGGWPHPRFEGRFLPKAREVGASEFKATWQLSDLATGGDAVLTAADATSGHGPSQAVGAVSLIDPIDSYALGERAVRYGFMFVLLTFATFFTFEIVKRWRIHAMQHLLVGAAVTIFFLLLFALAEHIRFAYAYAIAAAACVALITAYLRSILGKSLLALGFGAWFGALYTGLYFVLSSEDYALLTGTLFVFAMIGVIMYATRQVDWESLEARASGQPAV